MQYKYFHFYKRLVYIITESECEQDFFYSNLDDVEKNLLKIEDGWGRISNSCIVNMRKSIIVSRKDIKIDNEILTISDKYRNDF